MKKIKLILLLALLFPFIGNTQIDSTLIASIKAKNLLKIDSLLQAGIDLTATDENGANALMWACYFADSATVALLFDRGGEPPVGGGIFAGKEKSTWYGNLQCIAAGEGKPKLLRYLFEVQQLPVDEPSSHPTIDSLADWTPLMDAVWSDHANTIAVLLKAGVDIEFKNKMGQTAYDIAAYDVLKKILYERNYELLSELIVYQRSLNDFNRYYFSGKYLKAAHVLESVLVFIEENYGKESSSYASVIGSLSVCYKHLGFYERALPLYLNTVKITANLFGGKHIRHGYAISNLAALYHNMGLYEEALPLMVKALEIVQIDHKDDGVYGSLLNNIALTYRSLGRYEDALPYILTSLEKGKRTHGEQHVEFGIRLGNLASFYQDMGMYEDAESSYLKAIEIISKSQSKNHPSYGNLLAKLAITYKSMKFFKKAVLLLEESIKIIELNYSKNHLSYGFRLNDLALIYQILNSFEKSRSLYTEALKIVEKALGKENNHYLKIQDNLIELFRIVGLHDEGLSETNQALLIIISIINNQFPHLSQHNKLSWKKEYEVKGDKYNSFFVDCGIDIPLSLLNFNTSMKNLGIHNQNSLSKYDTTSKYNDWLHLKKKIGKQLSLPKEKRIADLAEWEKEADRLESYLMANSKTFRQKEKQISIQVLKENLLPEEAIIDFVHFRYYDIERRTDSVLYMAYLIPSSEENIKMIKLYEERELERMVGGIRNQHKDNRGIVLPGNQNLASPSMIWKPMLPHLSNYKTLYISPSGLLNRINLGVIPISKDSFLMDRFNIVQYNTLKSMDDEHEENRSCKFLLVGGIDYDQMDDSVELDTLNVSTEVVSIASYTNSDIEKMRSETRGAWEKLEGTSKEIALIDSLVRKDGNNKSIVLSGHAASEKTVKELLTQQFSPKVVHIATHGFFFPDVEFDKKDKIAFKASDNPMIRSGLILAGANHAWGNKPLPSSQEDGILTAYEVANLNLSNTELVVLSACETGLGDIQGSEGVFGLQRAFKMAGARHIIMSLKKVPDAQTQELMVSFYQKWLVEKQTLRDAFYAAQKEMRKKYRDPDYWAGFVLVE